MWNWKLNSPEWKLRQPEIERRTLTPVQVHLELEITCDLSARKKTHISDCYDEEETTLLQKFDHHMQTGAIDKSFNFTQRGQ